MNRLEAIEQALKVVDVGAEKVEVEFTGVDDTELSFPGKVLAYQVGKVVRIDIKYTRASKMIKHCCEKFNKFMQCSSSHEVASDQHGYNVVYLSEELDAGYAMIIEDAHFCLFCGARK